MIETKVSDAGWLCLKRPDGKWVPTFKLTPEQLQEWKSVTNSIFILKNILQSVSGA